MEAEYEEKYGIVFCFRLQDERTRKYLMNYLAMLRTASPCIHSEFYFINDATTVTVDSRRPVTFINFGNDYSDDKRWECYVLWVSKEVYNRVYEFCKKQKGVPFDHGGIYCFDFRECCTSPRKKNAWICSRLMTASLVHAGVLSTQTDVSRVAPSDLRELLLTQISKTHTVERYFFSR